MDATPQMPRPPLLKRMPPAAWTALVWGAAGIFPFLLYVILRTEPHDSLGLRVFLPALVTCLPAAMLRRYPLAALAMMIIATRSILVTLPNWQIEVIQFFTLDLAVCFIAATRDRAYSMAAALMVLVAEVFSPMNMWLVRSIFAPGFAGAFGPTVGYVVLEVGTAWMIGNSIRQRRVYAERLRQRAAVDAVTAERLRIARELHDMVAHSIGIIAIQAGVGSRVMDTQPGEARNALNVIEATSRETLAGLRRTLGALRRTDNELSAGAAPLGPLPSLAEVDQLAARTSDAGVRVSVAWLGERRPLPADIELAAYRIVQEAVTNVVRHAGTRECRVTVDYRDEEIAIEVVDDGRGDGAAPGAGYGIVGMRERVALLHGEFSAEPQPEGGFRVAVRLPVPAAAPRVAVAPEVPAASPVDAPASVTAAAQ